MRQCYFCKTKTGLKGIWMEDHCNDGFCNHASCRQCYKNNELDDYEEHYENWFSTDYNWQTKEERLREKQKTITQESQP